MVKNIILLVAISLSTITFAQKEITQGKIISKQTMSTDNEQVQAQLDMMGKMETVTFFKGTNSRMELDNPMSGTVTTIINGDQKKTLMMMDSPSTGKMYSIQDFSLTDEELKNIKVIKGSKTKTILGYECQEYLITITQNGSTITMVMFTTEAINVLTQNTATLGNKVKGYPLYSEITMNQMGIDMVVTTEVVQILDEAVSSDLFNLTPPEGYKRL